MKKDEFNSQPSEYGKLSKEIAPLGNEFNESGSKNLQSQFKTKMNAAKTKRKERRKKAKLIAAMFAGAGITGMTSLYSGASNVPVDYGYEFKCYNSAETETVNDDEKVVILTGNVSNISGSVWITEALNAEEGLVLEFDYMATGNLHDSENADMAGDGMAVSFVERDEFDIGKEKDGGELGYIGRLGVEYDFFQNPEGEIRGTKDFEAGHIAIIDEEMNHLAGTQKLTINGFRWYHTKIEYRINAENEAVIKAYLDNMLYAEYITDNPFEDLLVGISAGNGGATGWLILSDIKLNGKPVNVIDSDEKTTKGLNKDISSLPSTGRNTLIGLQPDAYEILPVISEENNDISSKEDEESGKKPQYPDETDQKTTKPDTGPLEETTDEPSGETVDEPSGETKSCDLCNGTGIICNGSVEADDPDGCGGFGIVACKACNNTGYENGRLCSWCNGTLQHICPSFEFHKTCEKCDGTGVIVE